MHFSLTSSGLTYYDHHFSYISNENETYLNYTGVDEYYGTGVIRPLKIYYFGRLSDEFETTDCNSTSRYYLPDDTLEGCKKHCRC